MKVYREEMTVWKHDGLRYSTYEAARAAWLAQVSRSIIDAAGTTPEALRRAADTIDLLHAKPNAPVSEESHFVYRYQTDGANIASNASLDTLLASARTQVLMNVLHTFKAARAPGEGMTATQFIEALVRYRPEVFEKFGPVEIVDIGEKPGETT